MTKPVRRIVTGHNAAGRSVFLMDGPAPCAHPAMASPAMHTNLIWRTTSAPASFKGNEDMAPASLRIPTAPQQRGGTVFRITDFPPDSQLGDPKDVQIGRHGVNVTEEGRKRHILFHQTDTVDYAIVLEGEIGRCSTTTKCDETGRRAGAARHRARMVEPRRQGLQAGLHPDRWEPGKCSLGPSAPRFRGDKLLRLGARRVRRAPRADGRV